MFLWFEDIENENFNLSMLRFTKFIFDLISSPFILNCETSTTAVYLRGKVDFGDWRTFVWIVGRCLIILSTIWKVSKYGAISGPYFPVFALNTEKYGPEITPYLATFLAVQNIWKSEKLNISRKSFWNLYVLLETVFSDVLIPKELNY